MWHFYFLKSVRRQPFSMRFLACDALQPRGWTLHLTANLSSRSGYRSRLHLLRSSTRQRFSSATGTLAVQRLNISLRRTMAACCRSLAPHQFSFDLARSSASTWTGLFVRSTDDWFPFRHSPRRSRFSFAMAFLPHSFPMPRSRRAMASWCHRQVWSLSHHCDKVSGWRRPFLIRPERSGGITSSLWYTAGPSTTLWSVAIIPAATMIMKSLGSANSYGE